MNILFFSLLSVFVSVFTIFLVIIIFKRFYEEQYKRPWLFIGLTVIFLGMSELLKYLSEGFGVYIKDDTTTQIIVNFLIFVANILLAYGLLLEFLILKYYPGKFVKMKFIPIQEGNIEGNIDLPISLGNSYLALKKDSRYILSEFSQGIKKGFEGFLLTETYPNELRTEYGMVQTPICYIKEISDAKNVELMKKELIGNTDLADPIELNNILSYITNFLEQSKKPFILLDLNDILKKNNYNIVNDFLEFLKLKVKNSNGVLICNLIVNVESNEIENLRKILKDIEI